MKYEQMRNIYGKCKSSRKIDVATYFGGKLITNHYSDDAAEALTSQAPEG
jgi:hypothetical protein